MAKQIDWRRAAAALQDAERELAETEGRRKQLLEQLKRLGCNSVEEAADRIGELEIEIEKANKELNVIAERLRREHADIAAMIGAS